VWFDALTPALSHRERGKSKASPDKVRRNLCFSQRAEGVVFSLSLRERAGVRVKGHHRPEL